MKPVVDPFKPGDRVWQYIPRVGTSTRPGHKLKAKLSMMWHGPYEVVSRVSETVYNVRSLGGGKPFAVNQAMLKRYVEPATEDPYFVDDDKWYSKAPAAEASTADDWDVVQPEEEGGAAWEEEEEEPPEADAPEEEEYEVERILDYRRRPGRGKPSQQYLVKFKGFPTPEWTRESNLSCPAAVKEYQDRVSTRPTVTFA